MFHLVTPTLALALASTIQRGDESLMKRRAHGTCARALPMPLRWSVDHATADNICCFNRHYAESSGSATSNALYMAEARQGDEITYYDSATSKPLFIAPRGRTLKDFLAESDRHGWPSFRTQEVVWENVRVLSDGEAVSIDGTHLGHNLPDGQGTRLCINLCSVAGRPPPRHATPDEARQALQDDVRQALRQQAGRRG